MILTGKKIENEVHAGKINISPFSKNFLNPNSYNFHLDKKILVYKNKILDPKKEQPTDEITIPKEGIILQPNKLYLGCTIEEIGSPCYVPLLFGRSSIGRLGLFVQITAPLGDIGTYGKWTLMLTPVLPIKVYYNMRIGQILFIAPKGEIELYKGKYKNSKKPRKSEIFKDFE